ncbi:Acyl-CoA dehydrogenase (plasmid) [Variovorax sp. SRS16]|uniref:acyl-CoA dehydrogenase n=1 Tax=Variovorax sp. SRS16 TaxID=282217 RepID=UPI001315F258|nr:acyl-CoA dehydrogenase [Variovorax sp. SRS16]VTU46362.1 Acyl-CoA dehydrogenase [Variovorax sp. SRS16]
MTHLDETQTMLRDSVQDFHERQPGPERVRRLREQPLPVDRAVWHNMAEAGWSGVLVPESLGGHGLGAAEAMLIASELGRGLAPEPFVACGLMVVQALVPLAAQSQAVRSLLDGVLAGSKLVGLAWQETAGALSVDDVRLRAVRSDSGWRFESDDAQGAVKRFVPLADAADGFLVYAQQDGGPALFWVEDAPVRSMRTIDGLNFGDLDLSGVRLETHACLARGPAVRDAVADAIELARLASAFELVGLAERALEITVAYTSQRVQFGKPIASFQALQHRMVDMWMQCQLARASAENALLDWTRPADDATRVQSLRAARARAGSAALFVGKNAIHLHGGMGIADETDIGLYLKRALALSAWLGNSLWQRTSFLGELLKTGRVRSADSEPLTVADGVDVADLSDEQFRRVLATWIASHYPPEKRFMKKRAYYADISDWYQSLSKKGWLAPAWPKSAGGMGLSAIKQVIYAEEIARHGCARIPDHGLAIGKLLLMHGTPEQIGYHLPRVLSGEIMWCQGYSEPNAGSDLASLRTRADRDGDDLVVNGQKTWTTLGPGADWMFALVRTSKVEGAKQRGITFLLIDLKTPGVKVRPIVNLKGEGEFSEVFFDHVRVPVSNVVGRIDDGWSVANSFLREERIFFGTPRQCEYALAQLDRLAQATRALQLADFRDRYAQLVLDVRDLKSAFELFMGRLRSGEELGPEVSYLKVWGTETYQRITDELVQLAGDHGGQIDDVQIDGIAVDVMNQYLDSRMPAIFGGSNEIQRNILAKQILALPSGR